MKKCSIEIEGQEIKLGLYEAAVYWRGDWFIFLQVPFRQMSALLKGRRCKIILKNNSPWGDFKQIFIIFVLAVVVAVVVAVAVVDVVFNRKRCKRQGKGLQKPLVNLIKTLHVSNSRRQSHATSSFLVMTTLSIVIIASRMFIRLCTLGHRELWTIQGKISPHLNKVK